jgi:hypothetical protein
MEFQITTDIECIPLEYQDILGTTMQILKIDSLLLINDFSGDTLIHVYNINSGHISHKLFSVGNGNGEMKSPLNLYLHNDELVIHHRQKRTIYSMPVDNIMKKPKIETKFLIPSDAFRLFPLCDSVFVSFGLYKKRYAFLDCSGTKIREFGEYPRFWKEEKYIPTEATAMYHQCFFLKHPVNKRFATQSNHICEIFDYSCDMKEEPVLIKSLLFGKYRYKYTVKNMLSTESYNDNEPGIMTADCDSMYIYLVCRSEDSTGNPAGSQIKIIDWDGNPVKQLNYPKKITCLKVDEREKKA